MLKPVIGLVLALLLPVVAAASENSHLEGRNEYLAPRAEVAPVINGKADDSAWVDASWYPIDQLWLGPDYDPSDYAGRFKITWTEDGLFLLAEFTDDVLFDSHRDPLVQYWDDDCLEIFLDEDHSGGEHHFNHNAFAYHFSLDNRAIDIGTDQKPRDYSHHVQSQWRQEGDRLVWEVMIRVYDDSYADDSDDNVPVVLTAGKVMGLMVAYCDNDGSELRENFIGSESVQTGLKDRGYIDAGIFGTLNLAE